MTTSCADQGTVLARAVFKALSMTPAQLNAFLVKYPLFLLSVLISEWPMSKNVVQTALSAGDVTALQVADLRAVLKDLDS